MVESTKIVHGVNEDIVTKKITKAAQQDHQGCPAGSSKGLGRIAEGARHDHLGGPSRVTESVQQEHRLCPA